MSAQGAYISAQYLSAEVDCMRGYPLVYVTSYVVSG